MDSIIISEGWLFLDDKKKLYTKTWKPSEATRAKLVFLHGFSDHCNAYGDLFPTLAGQGIEVFAFDQRGWGRSVLNRSDKGDTGPTSQVLDDITFVLSKVVPSDVPLFLMGHSMGGAEVLTYAAIGDPEIQKHIRGYMVEAPFIALPPATRPSKITVILGRLVGKILPRYQMVNTINVKLISRDPSIQQQHADDGLCHDIGTLEGLAGMLDRSAALENGTVKVGASAGESGKTRIWVSHGTADAVTCFEATKKLFSDLDVDDKEFKAYEGCYHMLHVEPEPDKTAFANDVAQWILQRSILNEPDGNTSKADAKL